MRSTNSVGRTLGILLLLHLVVGLTAPFIILHAVTGSRGFLLTAAENAVQVRTAVFLLTIGSAMAIAVSAAVLPTFRRYSSAMAFWLLFPTINPSWLPNSRENDLCADKSRPSIKTCCEGASRNWTV